MANADYYQTICIPGLNGRSLVAQVKSPITPEDLRYICDLTKYPIPDPPAGQLPLLDCQETTAVPAKREYQARAMERLRKLKDRHNLTAPEVAAELDGILQSYFDRRVSPSAVSNWLAGRNKINGYNERAINIWWEIQRKDYER